jgi:hypothetical protein
LRLLSAAKHSQVQPVVAGFDGFVDTILHAVSERRSSSEYTRLPTLRSFSDILLAASGGRNVNVETVPRQTKIGGNGPILANAMAHLGIPVTYIGCLGLPEIHPVFVELARKIKVYSIGEPGYSDAIEFNDGKLICGKHTSVAEISWQSVLTQLSAGELSELVDQAGLIAFLNWGSILSMTDMMTEFLHQIGAHLNASGKPFFIDTADPTKRSEQDILPFVEVLPRVRLT